MQPPKFLAGEENVYFCAAPALVFTLSSFLCQVSPAPLFICIFVFLFQFVFCVFLYLSLCESVMFILSGVPSKLSPAPLFICMLMMVKTMDSNIKMISVYCLCCTDLSVMWANLQMFTLCRSELLIDAPIKGVTFRFCEDLSKFIPKE